jgi:hypothetical protein
MVASAARIAANRANSALSTGPKTSEGKERSRRNGLKHGLTGDGIVVPDDDSAEVERRAASLLAEMGARTAVGEILVRQIARLSVRMERSAAQEFAAIAVRVRHAADEFDEERHARAAQLLATIGDDPRGNLRRLRKMPEGVDLLLLAWQDLRASLTLEPNPVWTEAEMFRAASLAGIREQAARSSTLGLLSAGVLGEFGKIFDNQTGLESDDARKAWARAQLVERIDEAIGELEEHRESLDFEMIELDRAEAGDRALFDPSREATLARRYESEARRGFFRALKDFRQAEADFAPAVKPTPQAPAPLPRAPETPLASSCAGPVTPVRVPEPVAPRIESEPISPTFSVARGRDGAILSIGKSPRAPG